VALDPAVAAGRYRGGESACQIAAGAKLTKAGAEGLIRKGGISGGLAWCPLHRVIEVLGQ
jgi:hypothetical protein